MNEKIRNLENENQVLRKQLNILMMQNKNLKKSYECLEKKVNDIVEKAVKKAVKKALNENTIKYEKKIKELNNTIAKLESKLNINSSNSSLPSSKNPQNIKISNLRKKTDKSIGGQIGHKSHKLEKFTEEEITETKEHSLDGCPICNGKLTYKNTVLSDIIDYVVKVKKTRNVINNYYCSHCKKDISSNTTLPRGTSYGSNINASSIILMNEANVPINKVRKYYNGLTDGEINISEGYLAKLQVKTANLLNDFITDVKQNILKESIVHWDDTTIKIGKKDAILRFYGNEKLALLIAHENKNAEGIKADGILNKLGKNTTVVHDHLLYNYNSEFEFKNAECNAHILRYLESVSENTHTHTWEKTLAKLLCEANDNRVGKTHYEQKEIDEIYRKYDEAIQQGYKENAELGDYHFYYEKELKLIKRLDKYRDSHLLFIKDFNVPFTNNTAEKSFRISKTKLKVSGLFQNNKSAMNYSIILSYMETCYRNGINKLQAIKRLLEGNPYTVDELLKVTK